MKNLALLLCFSPLLAFSQTNKDSIQIKKIFNEALTNGKCYQQLDYLTNQIGGRLSGSDNAAKAVKWGEKELKAIGVDTVFLQEVMVPHWVRGEKEQAKAYIKGIAKDIAVTALGGSVATPSAGLKAHVIEVHNFEELQKLGAEKVHGNIIFFNRPMDPTQITTFHAYSGAVDQRGRGAIEAAKLGAVAVLVRSMTLSQDDVPHTGAMRYDTSVTKIPAAAISTNAANMLSDELKKEPATQVFLKMSCNLLPDAKSYNVVAQITGTELPKEYVIVGGHLDSWDTGKGAHDDGSGIVQSMEVMRVFKAIGLKPKRSIRAVLFMNEENGLKGGKKYAELAEKNNEKHIAAIESDAGGFAPIGFSMEAPAEAKQKVNNWKVLLEPDGLHDFNQTGGGADISPLAGKGVTLMELRVESQRYFDYHHTSIDTFDKVNKRELELGAASMASMVWLISEYGL